MKNSDDWTFLCTWKSLIKSIKKPTGVDAIIKHEVGRNRNRSMTRKNWKE